jgi:DNA-binding MarR family transcriptional regulator
LKFQPKGNVQPEDYSALGAFRYAVRKFLRFSKEVLAVSANLTPEQYEALLALKIGSNGHGMPIRDLSERLQVKHHTTVSLVNRLARRDLVRREPSSSDGRLVHIKLTKFGNSILAPLVEIHRQEMRHRSLDMINALRRLRN